MKRLRLGILLMLLCGSVSAAGDKQGPPLEDMLRRAETVFIAQITSDSTTTIIFKPVHVLRGKADASLTLTCEDYKTAAGTDGAGRQWFISNTYFLPARPSAGTEWLLISQGDERFGPPRPVIARPSKPESDKWRGWIAVPILELGDQLYASTLESFIDGEPFVDKAADGGTAGLSLERVKRLLGRFPYDAHTHE